MRVLSQVIDISVRKAQEVALRRAAMFDELTGLSNRSVLQQKLGTLLGDRSALGPCITLLLLDLDHLHRMNDTLGHSAGDRLLKLVSERGGPVDLDRTWVFLSEISLPGFKPPRRAAAG